MQSGISTLPRPVEPAEGSDTRLQRAMDRAPLRWAQAKVAPQVLLNAARRALEPEIHANRDFGNIRNKGNQTQIIVTHPAAAQHHLRQAFARGQALHVAGARHSSNGHTLASQGAMSMQLNPSAWGAPRWVGNHELEVAACMRWREVEAFAQTQGRTIPVLTDHLGTSVGGTLSVGGGIGCRSVVAGRQLDHIKALRLIYPNGNARWIGPECERELFSFVLGGQGTLGVIDRVVTSTVAYRPFTTEFKLQFRSLCDAARAAEEFCNRADTPDSFTRLDFVGPLLNTRVVELSLGFEFETRQEAKAMRRNPPPGIVELKERIVKRQVIQHMAHHNNARSSAYISTLTRASNPHCFYWNDFFFPDPISYGNFLAHLEQELFPRLGNRYLMAALGLAYATPTHGLDFPMSGMQTKPGRRPWSIGLNYAVPASQRQACLTTAQALSDLQSTCHQMGGRVYRYGYSNAKADTFAKVYGQDYQRLKALKQRLDPQCILNPGVLGLQAPPSP